MLKQTETSCMTREALLAAAIVDVAGELRAFDVADLVAFIRADDMASLGQLVQSSAEMYFKPDTLRLGLGADVALSWSTPPTITLDLEFSHVGVTVYFRLLLEARAAAIDISFVEFDAPAPDHAHNTARLEWAIADARLPQRKD